jgi:hypothetical protein
MKEIELSKTGKNKGKYKAKVDDELFDIVNKINWSYNGYAYNSKMNIYLHAYIWKLKFGDIPKELEIEHKDQNKLNCQISNLRLATRAQNMRNKSKTKRNKSGFIGVSKDAQKHKNENGTNINEYWICSWYDNLGKQRRKYFSYDNVGKVRAARYYDIMTEQFAEEYTGELNFNSLEEYQKELKKAILEDIESNY